MKNNVFYANSNWYMLKSVFKVDVGDMSPWSFYPSSRVILWSLPDHIVTRIYYMYECSPSNVNKSRMILTNLILFSLHYFAYILSLELISTFSTESVFLFTEILLTSNIGERIYHVKIRFRCTTIKGKKRRRRCNPTFVCISTLSGPRDRSRFGIGKVLYSSMVYGL